MDWVPVVLLTFKFLVLGIGMFFAIKWHYDQGKKGKALEKRAMVRAAGKMAAVFVLPPLGLVALTFFLARMIGLNLIFP
jgi:hypothetical protein